MKEVQKRGWQRLPAKASAGTVKLQVQVETAVVDRLEELSFQKKRTIPELTREAVEQYLKRHKPRKAKEPTTGGPQSVLALMSDGDEERETYTEGDSDRFIDGTTIDQAMGPPPRLR